MVIDSDGFVKAEYHRREKPTTHCPESDTTQIVFEDGRKVTVCAKWVDFCLETNVANKDALKCFQCGNTHLRLPICRYYVRGVCRNGTRCRALHAKTLNHVSGVATNTCNEVLKPKTITVKGVVMEVCPKWYDFCLASKEEQSELKCQSCTLLHPSTPICWFFVNKTCKNGDACVRLHPEEASAQPKTRHVASLEVPRALAPVAPRRASTKTAICASYLYRFYRSGKTDGCSFGARCIFAHNIQEVQLVDALKGFNSLIRANPHTISLQEVFEEVYRVVSTNYGFIRFLKEETGETLPACPMPLPGNFDDLVRIWVSAAAYARKIKARNTLALFGAPDNIKENFVWGLSRRIFYCRDDITCETARIAMKTNKIARKDICNYAGNCKRGVHVSCVAESGCVDAICMDELCGKCTCPTVDAVATTKERLTAQLQDLFKQRATLTAKSTEAQSMEKVPQRMFTSLDNAIWNVAGRIATTVRKTHLVADFGFSPLKPITEKIESFGNVVLSDSDFASGLHATFAFDEAWASAQSDEIKQEIAKKRAIALVKNSVRSRAAEVCEVFRVRSRIRSALIHGRVTPADRALVNQYVSTKAYKYLTIEAFIGDTRSYQIYNHWIAEIQELDFATFRADIRNKTLIWESMGIVRSIRVDKNNDEVIVEDTVPSEKDNYRDFWMWLHRIPLSEDPVVLGSAREIAHNNPSLFEEYKEANASSRFEKSFSDWLEKDTVRSEAIRLSQTHGVGYVIAYDFVHHRVAQYGMSLQEFAQTNRQDVFSWIRVNENITRLTKCAKKAPEEFCNVNLHPSVTSSGKIPFAAYLQDRKVIDKFYLQSYCFHYRGNFQKFAVDFATPDFIFPDISDFDSIEKIQERRRLALARFEAENSGIFIKGSLLKNLYENLLIEAPAKAPKGFKAREDRIQAKEATKKEKLASRQARRQRIEEEREEKVRRIELDDGTDLSNVYATKAIPPHLYCPLKRGARLYFHREVYKVKRVINGKLVQVEHRDIIFGPFTDKSDAETVLATIIKQRDNRLFAGFGKELQKVSICVDKAKPGKYLETFHIVFKDTYTLQQENKIIRNNINPFEWLFKIITILQGSVLASLPRRAFQTDIFSLDSLLVAWQNAKTNKSNKHIEETDDESEDESEDESDDESDEESDDEFDCEVPAKPVKAPTPTPTPAPVETVEVPTPAPVETVEVSAPKLSKAEMLTARLKAKKASAPKVEASKSKMTVADRILAKKQEAERRKQEEEREAEMKKQEAKKAVKVSPQSRCAPVIKPSVKKSYRNDDNSFDVDYDRALQSAGITDRYLERFDTM